MKTKYILLLLLICPFVACEDWLDISPKTEIKSDDNFENEQGYKDALTGIYLLMTDESLYGCETTYGMLDAMAQYYRSRIQGSSHKYYYDYQYNFEEAASKGRVNTIWNNMYNAIANTNELIEKIDKDTPSKFTGNNYKLIRGEAYGLRAFLHFDLLRLFGDSYVVGADNKAIPYVKSVSTQTNSFVTTKEAAQSALADLSVAEEMLKVADPVISTNTSLPTADTNYERDRTFKFNYYAVKLLQARIHLFVGNLEEAEKAAKEVMAQQTFSWTPSYEITNMTASQRNRIFSQELVFSLYVSNLTDLYTTNFTTNTGLYMSDQAYNALFELLEPGYSSDYRYVYQTDQLTDGRFSIKYQQPAGGNSSYLNRIPLMRLSEAYYIAAECALERNDISTAVNTLNEVRSIRNISNELSPDMDKQTAEDELYKEYAKEFYAEGQLFYFFKRKNYEQITVRTIFSDGYISTTMVTPIYKMPLPDDEIEFGDGKSITK